MHSQQNERAQSEHARALAWRAQLSLPHALAWLEQDRHSEGPLPVDRRRLRDYAIDRAAVQLTHKELFGTANFPADIAETNLVLRRDALGKPYAEWQGAIEAWANAQGRKSRHFHISNTHDGGAHLVLAAYSENLAGIGIDAVYLPRLRHPEKDRAYLHRFAQQFMSPQERELFLESALHDDEEALRIRVAAHFSLMEAASKACGTGLKIGAGMGRSTSLSKFALGVRQLSPQTELLFTEEAVHRLEALGAVRAEAHWSADDTFLISVVLLYKNLD